MCLLYFFSKLRRRQLDSVILLFMGFFILEFFIINKKTKTKEKKTHKTKQKNPHKKQKTNKPMFEWTSKRALVELL